MAGSGGNNAHRDELQAARARARTLEAQLVEKGASLDARDAELAELRARLKQVAPPDAAKERHDVRSTTILGGIGLAVVLLGSVSYVAVTAGSGHGVINHHPLRRPQSTQEALPKGPTLMWHGTVARTPATPNRTPVVVDVNRDGIDDAIGIVYPPGKDGHARVGAFSGVDAQPLWLSQKLGWVPEGIGDVVMLVDGESALATANDGTLHILDIATGKPRTRRASTYATRLCATDEGPLAETGDDGALIWNPKTKTIENSSARCADAPHAPTADWPSLDVDDFTPVSFEVVEDRVYALGRTGRLEQPDVLAYDLTAKRLLWRVRATGSEDVYAHSPWFQHIFARANGCVYVEVEVQEMTDHGLRPTGGRPLTCFDENTGERRWSQDHREHGSLATGFVAGASRLFWVRHERVDIIDVNDGKAVGHIGWQ